MLLPDDAALACEVARPFHSRVEIVAGQRAIQPVIRDHYAAAFTLRPFLPFFPATYFATAFRRARSRAQRVFTARRASSCRSLLVWLAARFVPPRAPNFRNSSFSASVNLIGLFVVDIVYQTAPSVIPSSIAENYTERLCIMRTGPVLQEVR